MGFIQKLIAIHVAHNTRDAYGRRVLFLSLCVPGVVAISAQRRQSPWT